MNSRLWRRGQRRRGRSFLAREHWGGVKGGDGRCGGVGGRWRGRLGGLNGGRFVERGYGSSKG